MSLYSKRGVSAQKEEVHQAVESLDQGLFPRAFCKIYPDYLGGDDQFINIMHADGAGTKSILAYLYWQETGDISVWRGIAQDAIVMNLDDLLCAGVYDNIVFSSTIDRNKNLIPGDVLREIIEGSRTFFARMAEFGIRIQYLGGETADVGDVVRTIAVNGTMAVRWPRNRVITNERITPGNVIVGLASYGQATYEDAFNSGIGSNGLTSARHDVLNKSYTRYTESFDPALSPDVVYIGKHQISEMKEVLSPTRTYAPLMKELLQNHFDEIYGLIHCSGGGQTKCLKYVPDHVEIVKDALFETPSVFREIQAASGASLREMYEVFNMGCRLEIYTSQTAAEKFIAAAQRYGIDAQVIGRVEAAEKKTLTIEAGGQKLHY